MTNTALLREIHRDNKAINRNLQNADLVFSILSHFFKDSLYKSTLKSAIIRVIMFIFLLFLGLDFCLPFICIRQAL